MKTLFHKKNLLILLQLLITLIFLYLTFHNIHLHTLIQAFLKVNYYFLVLAIIPQFVGIIFLALREKFLLRQMYNFKFRDLFKASLLGCVGNNILPLRAGEFLKVLYWAKKSHESYISLLSIAFLERVFDLLCLLFLFIMASKKILLQLGVQLEGVIIFLTLVILPIFILLFLDWKYKKEFTLHHSLKKILGEKITNYTNDFLNKLMKGLRILGSGENTFLALFFSILYWISNLLGTAMILYACHIPVSVEQVVIILLAISFGTAIPAAPGFIGTWDYFAKMALVLYGVNQSIAASFAIISHFISIVPITLIGILFLYPTFSELLMLRKTRNHC